MSTAQVLRKNLAVSYGAGTAVFRGSATVGGQVLIEGTAGVNRLQLVRNDDGADVAHVSGWSKTTGGTYVEVARLAVATRSASAGAGEISMQVKVPAGSLTTTLMLDEKGSVVLGAGALAASATDGFVYVPTVPAEPSGVPTSHTGRSPIVVDDVGNKLWFYAGGAWRSAASGGGASLAWNLERPSYAAPVSYHPSFELIDEIAIDRLSFRYAERDEVTPRLMRDVLTFAGRDVVIGDGPLAHNATSGYLYLPAVDGLPEGFADAHSGRVAVTFDRVSAQLYVRSLGAWYPIGGGGTVDLSGYMPTTWTLTANGGLSGGGDGTASRTVSIATAGVTSAMLRDSVAVSVIGRSAGSAGVPADIAAGVDGYYLRQVSGSLSFGTILDGHIPSTIVRTSAISIANTQVAVGSGVGTLAGSSGLTFASGTLSFGAGTIGAPDAYANFKILAYDSGNAQLSYGLGVEAQYLWLKSGASGVKFYAANVEVARIAVASSRYQLLFTQNTSQVSFGGGGTIGGPSSYDNFKVLLGDGGSAGATYGMGLEPNYTWVSSGAGSGGLRVYAGGTLAHELAQNVSLFGAGSYGAGVGVLFTKNRTTAPTSNPAGGGILYADGGQPAWRDSDGNLFVGWN